ncbi:hypothetical protein LCGC14_1862440 [marine sediment metagenome]|uniref:Uncharacterized protein n=1 Tax=marine sediment metagenome TaxID=412755 RepID=A0A0F9G7H2_9ZZZZ
MNQEQYDSIWKLAYARNPKLRLAKGWRVKVPRGVTKVFIPRQNHSARKVYTEDKDFRRLELLYDDLQPCIVRRGAFGWAPHKCKHHPLVVITEG